MQNNVAGFSILEVLMVLLLISILGSFVVPTFMSKKSVVKKQFISDFTTLMQEALFHAIMQKKIHQIIFNFEEKTIKVNEFNSEIKDSDTHKRFSPSLIASIAIPNTLEFKNFYIQKNDELQSGKITKDAWFYIMPDGTSQPITLNIENTTQDPSSLFSLSVNPFYSQVEEYEMFQTP